MSQSSHSSSAAQRCRRTIARASRCRLSPGLSNLAADLRAKVQGAFDAPKTGVEVVAIDLPMLRPSGESAPKFEELAISEQARQEMKAIAERNVFATFTDVLGDASLAPI